MRIMVFSNGAWDDTNATGNTMSNFFTESIWKKDTFYNIYMRSAMPNNNICKNYYRLLLIDMIKNFFCKENIGYEFVYTNDIKNVDKNILKEKKIIDIIHKYSLNFAYLIADYIYRRKKWINKRFDKYIQKANPDIFYAHVNNFAILCPMIEYIKNKTHAKIVLLLTDDLFNDINNKFFLRRKKLKKDYINIINMADKIYAVSEELKYEYEKIFNRHIDILYKGCFFDFEVKSEQNNPIKLVYAGNLFYGRDKILSKLAKTIERNNHINNKKAILEIYTGATISKDMDKCLNIENCSYVLGKRNYDEIKKIMNMADYNLHVESFSKSNIEYVRYSFSTKIIDCLQAGSSIIGIGPKDISSMKYIQKIPGAHVITDLDKIENEIFKLINKSDIQKDAKNIRKYALNKHDIICNSKRLRNDFINICNK